jgi:hypothetical protein
LRSDTAIRYGVTLALLSALTFGCKEEKPPEPKKVQPPMVFSQKHPGLTDEQRGELNFSADILSEVEIAAGAEAEPFFETTVVKAENLKGETSVERERLAGFSVRTKRAIETVDTLSGKLRARGYLIFRCSRNYGNVPDLVAVVKGNSSYDILKRQKTESINFHLDTKAIVAWLKEQQKEGTFVIVGAGPDWVEARFIKPPKNMLSFARKIYAFAPDTVSAEAGTLEKLAKKMTHTNRFFLVWD